MVRNSTPQSDFLRRRLAPFLLTNRSRTLQRKHKMSVVRQCGTKGNRKITKQQLPQNLDETWDVVDETASFNSFVSTSTVPRCDDHDVQECFNLEISSWDGPVKHDGEEETSFGCVHEIDSFLAESESCSKSDNHYGDEFFPNLDGETHVEAFPLM